MDSSTDHRPIRGTLGLTSSDRRGILFWCVLMLIALVVWFVGNNSGPEPTSMMLEERILDAESPSQDSHVESSEITRDINLHLPINTADSVGLLALPGIGPVLAGRIVRDRADNGPYDSLEDLLRVNGVGPKKLEQIKDHLEQHSVPQ